jgi:UDP:flavonoid glycosyltransferase YjiC (YdhE family)
VPFGRVQPEVARQVMEAGAGVRLRTKHLTPERLRAHARGDRDAPRGAAAGERMRAAGRGALRRRAEELVAETALAAHA